MMMLMEQEIIRLRAVFCEKVDMMDDESIMEVSVNIMALIKIHRQYASLLTEDFISHEDFPPELTRLMN